MGTYIFCMQKDIAVLKVENALFVSLKTESLMNYSDRASVVVWGYTDKLFKNFPEGLPVNGVVDSASMKFRWPEGDTRGSREWKIGKHALIRSIDLNKQTYNDFRDECRRFVNGIEKLLH